MPDQVNRDDPVGFYNLAQDFHKSACLVAAKRELRELRLTFEDVPYHLHSHSIELALKTLLLADGIPIQDLKKKYSHGLLRLFDASSSRKLNPKKPKSTRAVIAMLDAFVASQGFRYFKVGFRRLPRLDEVRNANLRLLDAVKRHRSMRRRVI